MGKTYLPVCTLCPDCMYCKLADRGLSIGAYLLLLVLVQVHSLLYIVEQAIIQRELDKGYVGTEIPPANFKTKIKI